MIRDPHELARQHPDLVADLKLFDGLRRPGSVQVYDSEGDLVCAFVDGEDQSDKATKRLEDLQSTFVKPVTEPPLPATWTDSQGRERKVKSGGWD